MKDPHNEFINGEMGSLIYEVILWKIYSPTLLSFKRGIFYVLLSWKSGNRYYRDSKDYSTTEIRKVIAEIQGKKFPVYYDQARPEKAICFITDEDLRLNKALGVAIGVSWLIWGMGYLQTRIWDKNQ